MKSSLAIATALAGVLSASLASAWAPNPTIVRTLSDGKPYSEAQAAPDGAGLLHAAVDIPVPPKTVWMVMNDCRMIPKLILTVTSCKVLQGDERGGWDIRETVTKGNFFVPEIHNVYRSDYQPYSVIRFKKAGGNLKVEEGQWRLESLNNGAGTRVIYENLVAADIMVPGSLVREGMRRDTAKVLANLRNVSMSVAR